MKVHLPVQELGQPELPYTLPAQSPPAKKGTICILQIFENSIAYRMSLDKHQKASITDKIKTSYRILTIDNNIVRTKLGGYVTAIAREVGPGCSLQLIVNPLTITS